MMLTLSSSRSAIALNCWLSSRSSRVPCDSSSDGDARREVPVGEAAARLGEPGDRRGEPVGEERRDEHGDEERDAGHDQQQRRDVGERARPARVRVGQRDDDAPVRRVVGRSKSTDCGRDRGVLRLAGLGLHLGVGREHEVRLGLDDRDAVGVRADEADGDRRVGLRDRLGGERRTPRSSRSSRAAGLRITVAVRELTDRRPGRPATFASISAVSSRAVALARAGGSAPRAGGRSRRGG